MYGDWNIRRVANFTYLIHSCATYRKAGINEWAYEKMSEWPGTCFYLRGTDVWRCRRCHEAAPAEIAFVAELASCYNVASCSKDHCYWVERQIGRKT